MLLFRRPRLAALLLIFTPVLLAPLHAEDTRRPATAAESEARLKRDIFFLASDECEGRGPATEGLKKAGDYVAAEFKKAGLKPGNPDGTWFQNFTIDRRDTRSAGRTCLSGAGQEGAEAQAGSRLLPDGHQRVRQARRRGDGLRRLRLTTKSKGRGDSHAGLRRLRRPRRGRARS